MNRRGDTRYRSPDLGGDSIRVIIMGDVIALPDEGWSDHGYGQSISVSWLLHNAHHEIPGNKAKRTALARVIAEALWDHHHDTPVPAHLLEA